MTYQPASIVGSEDSDHGQSYLLYKAAVGLEGKTKAQAPAFILQCCAAQICINTKGQPQLKKSSTGNLHNDLCTQKRVDLFTAEITWHALAEHLTRGGLSERSFVSYLVHMHLHRDLLAAAACYCLGLVKADADFHQLCWLPTIVHLIRRDPSLQSWAILYHMRLNFMMW